MGAVRDDEDEGAFELTTHGTYGGRQIPVALGVALLDEMRDSFRVGLAAQGVTARLQALAELGEVLDRPVVHDRDSAGAVGVGMCVAVRGGPMGGPTRVSDAERAGELPLGDRGVQVGQLAGATLDRDLVTVEDGHAGGVVTAVLEPAQALHDNVESGLLPDIADD